MGYNVCVTSHFTCSLQPQLLVLFWIFLPVVFSLPVIQRDLLNKKWNSIKDNSPIIFFLCSVQFKTYFYLQDRMINYYSNLLQSLNFVFDMIMHNKLAMYVYNSTILESILDDT